MAYTTTVTGEKIAFEFPLLYKNRYTLEDIAHHLSMVNRFGGATKFPYSVAQHQVLGAQHILSATNDPVLGLDFLFHDAPEAYMGDMRTPLKRIMPQFRQIEDDMDLAIRTSLDRRGIPVPLYVRPETKKLDAQMFLTEKDQLCAKTGWRWDYPAEWDEWGPLPIKIKPWDWHEAKDRYLGAIAAMSQMARHRAA